MKILILILSSLRFTYKSGGPFMKQYVLKSRKYERLSFLTVQLIKQKREWIRQDSKFKRIERPRYGVFGAPVNLCQWKEKFIYSVVTPIYRETLSPPQSVLSTLSVSWSRLWSRTFCRWYTNDYQEISDPGSCLGENPRVFTVTVSFSMRTSYQEQ